MGRMGRASRPVSVPPFDQIKNGGTCIMRKKNTTLFLASNAVIAALYAA